MKQEKYAITYLILMVIFCITISDSSQVYAKQKRLSLDWVIEPQITSANIEPIQYDVFTGMDREEDFSAYSFDIGSDGKKNALIDYNGKRMFEWKHYMYIDYHGLHVYDTQEQQNQGGALSFGFLYDSKLKLIGPAMNDRGEMLYYIDVNTGRQCEYPAGYGVSALYYTDKKLKTGVYDAVKVSNEVTSLSEPNYEGLGYKVMIDVRGKMIKGVRFEDGRTLQEGLVLVKQNKKWGYIDGNGKTVIPCQYEAAYSFRDGKAAVKKNGKWGYIYMDGSTCIDFVLDEARPPYKGKGWAKKDGYWGMLNLSGKKAAKIHYQTNVYTRPEPSYINGYPIEPNKTVYYDLDGDGKKEAIKYKIIGENKNYDYVKGIELYVNNKKIMKNNTEALGYSVDIYDIDKKDSKLDIYISGSIENGYSAYKALGQFYGGKYHTVKVFKDNGGGNIVLNKEQDGTFRYESFTGSTTMSHYTNYVNYKIEKGSLKKLSSGISTQQEYYMLAEDLPVYEKADKMSQKRFNLSGGSVVTVSKLTKKEGIEFLYIRTLDGKQGWIWKDDNGNLFNNVYWAG